jgi:hypothetical protein
MRLRARGVLVNDEGTLRNGTLTFAEQQSVKWLNILLLTTALFREAFLTRDVSTRRISPRRTTITRAGSAREEEWVVRYFERSDSAYYQRAYEDAAGLHAVEESLVVRCDVRSDCEYAVSLLFWAPSADVSRTQGSIVGPVGKAAFRNAANPGDEDDFRWDIYYSLYGTVMMDNALTRIDGNVVLLQSVGYLHGSTVVTKQNITSVLRITRQGASETVRKTHIEVEATQ